MIIRKKEATDSEDDAEEDFEAEEDELDGAVVKDIFGGQRNGDRNLRTLFGRYIRRRNMIFRNLECIFAGGKCFCECKNSLDMR